MHNISWWRTDFGEDEARSITDSIRKECISQGPVTGEFEKAISAQLGVPYVVATTSGSMAILMALIAAGIKPGDEVIVPNRTWIATAHAPLLLGARVVLVDVERDRPVINVSKVEKKITNRTRAIIAVHLNGRAAGIKELNRIALKRRIRVIEDAAQAFCSKNSSGMLGCQSFAGCFSLSVAKIISTGQGGFVVTKDKDVYKRLRLMRTHGVSDLVNTRYAEFGFNFRFTDIQASMGLAQLRRLSKRIKRVKEIYIRYNKGLEGVPFLNLIPVNIDAGEIPVYTEILCRNRDGLMKFLSGRGIQTRPFYPDLNSAKYLKGGRRYPNSEVFSRDGLFLPCGPAQPHDAIERTIEALGDFYGEDKCVR